MTQTERAINDLACANVKQAREIGLLKRLVKAQERMLRAYAIGKLKVPEEVYDTLNEGKEAGLING